MKLLLQDKDYECVLSAVAMCLDYEHPENMRDMLLRELVHDPEEVLWPNAPGARKYRGIQMEDLLPLIFDHGYIAMPFFKVAMVNGTILNYYGDIPIDGNKGVIMFLDQGHVVAWDGKKIYDPRGYVVDEITGDWNEFWLFRMR